MKKKLGVLLIVLVLTTIVYALLNDFFVHRKIVKKINEFYGDDIEIVSVEHNFKLSEKGHAHYDVLAKKRNNNVKQKCRT